MFNRDTIIYLAAIIDGEGSIQIEIQSANNKSRKVDYYSIRLLVINTNIELMEWLVKNFGGRSSKRKLITGRRQCYVWSLFSHNAAALLKECEPFMIIKKKHAQAVIEFMALKDKDSWYLSEDLKKKREELFRHLKTLNKYLN